MEDDRKIKELIKKAKEHYDSSERWMAVNDLRTTFEAPDAHFSADIEKRTCEMLLDRFENDPNTEVQAICVRCLSILVKKIQIIQLKEVSVQLCKHLFAASDELRDIYAIGIKTILADTPPAFAKDVSFSILVELEPGLTGGKLERGVREQVLELITEVLSRYGCQDTARNSTMMEELLDGLAHKALRKRVTAALAALAPSLTDPQLHQVITALLGKINSPKPGDDIPTLVQCLGRLARSVGRRLGPHAPNIMPVFFRQLGEADHEELLDDLAIDVKENSLQAIESFVRQCPGAVTPWIEQALMVANGYLKYDPNFDYEAEEEEEDEDMEGEESEEEEEEYSDMSDDDDNTWKIRRAAVRVISAIASCRHDILPFIFKNYGGALVDRFKEREESVRVDILATFTQLLDNAIETHESHVEAVPSADVDVDMTGQSAWAGAGFGPGGGMEPGLPGGTTASLLGAHPGARAAVRQGLITPPPAVRAPGFINELRDMIKVIAESILRVFEKSKTGDSRTRMAAWQLLQKLVLVMGDDFADVNSLFIPQLRSALKDKTSQLRFEALNFIRMVLDRCSPLHTQPHLPVLVPLVTASVHDEWYKIVAEALRTIGRCAICIRPATEDERDLTAGVDPSPYLSALFEATFSKLSATDIDQEIKEAAISAMSLILGHLGDHLNKNQLDAVLPLFLERLQNEVTRLATLRGLAFVVLSPLSLDFSSILQPTVQELGSLLRQKSRILKQAVLKLLVALVTWQSQKLPVALMEPVMHEGAALISDDDLQLAAHMIELCVTVSIHHADAAKLLGKDILTAALQLAGSPLVQGEALEFLRSLFKKIAVLSGCVMSYDDLMEGLFAFATEHADSKAIQRHTLLSLSNCTAALCGAADATKQKATVLRLVDLLNGESVNLRIMVLHTLAALGKQLNILSIKPSALTDAMALFDSAAHEEVKIAAASAVGGIAVGAPDGSIPVLLEKIQSSSHTYLLLAALKDAFYAQARKEADFGPHVPALLDSLLAHTADKDEGVRAITSECLGLLAIANPDTLADVLSKLVTSDQPLQRCAAATAMQYPISILQRLGTARLEPFVDATCDQDLLVRQAAFQTITTWAHRCPTVLEPFFTKPDRSEITALQLGEPPKGPPSKNGLLPVIYYEMIFRKDLVRVIDLGPFTGKKDDGLAVRKSAYAAVDCILANMPQVLGPEALMRVIAGLEDPEPDVMMLAHQLLVRMLGRSRWIAHILGALPAISRALEASIPTVSNSKDKGMSEGGDVLRSMMRLVDGLSRLEDAMLCKEFASLYKRCTSDPTLGNLLKGIHATSVGSDGRGGWSASAGGGGGGGGGVPHL